MTYLSDQQLSMVTRMSHLLPPELHGWFSRRIADELGHIQYPTDDEVRLAIGNTLPLPLDMFDVCEGSHTLDLFDGVHP